MVEFSDIFGLCHGRHGCHSTDAKPLKRLFPRSASTVKTTVRRLSTKSVENQALPRSLHGLHGHSTLLPHTPTCREAPWGRSWERGATGLPARERERSATVEGGNECPYSSPERTCRATALHTRQTRDMVRLATLDVVASEPRTGANPSEALTSGSEISRWLIGTLNPINHRRLSGCRQISAYVAGSGDQNASAIRRGR